MNKKEFIQHTEHSVQTVLEDNEILKGLAAVGFGRDVIISGLSLRSHVKTTRLQQQNEYSDKVSATENLNAARNQANAFYKHHLATARFALKDDLKASQRLMLNGPRSRALLPWLEQAETFYANVFDYTAILKKYNLTQAELTEGQEQLSAVAEAFSRQSQEKNEARQATCSREEAKKAFVRWDRRYKQAVQLAFSEQPDVLIRLGYDSQQRVY